MMSYIVHALLLYRNEQQSALQAVQESLTKQANAHRIHNYYDFLFATIFAYSLTELHRAKTSQDDS